MAPTPTAITTATDAGATAGPGAGREVLVVLHEPVVGGATLSVLRTLPLLVERGWRFCVWAPRPSELYDYVEAAGWEVRGAPRTVSYSLAALRLPPGPRARLRSMPAYLGALRDLVHERRPALAHVNSLTTLAEAAIVRSARRARWSRTCTR